MPGPIPPKLIAGHPLTCGYRNPMRPLALEVFPPFSKALPDTPVGFSVTLAQCAGIPMQLGTTNALIAGYSRGVFSSQSVKDMVGDPERSGIIRLALDLPHQLQDMAELNMAELALPESGAEQGYFMRTLWVFPSVALLMDDIQEVICDEPKYLRNLAIAFYEKPGSQHERLARCRELNDLMAIASTQAVPSTIGEWPEGYSMDRLDFAEITPDQLEMA